MVKHLLIDAKNMLYRAVYTARSDSHFQKSGHHGFNIVLHFITNYFEKFKPENIHVFWDSRRDSTWRRNLVPSYKRNRSSDDEIDNALINLTEVSTAVFKQMGMRQYYQDKMEADDLIFAFCKSNYMDQIVIVSSDGDLKQIPFHYPNVRVYRPHDKGAVNDPPPVYNPAVSKCFIGDRSDNIDGYYGIGKVKAKALTEDMEARNIFFNSSKAIVKEGLEKKYVGPKRFGENLRLIDLSLCPYVLENMMYISKKQFKPVKFDLKEIRKLISKYKLRGVTADMSRYITPFRQLEVDHASSHPSRHS